MDGGMTILLNIKSPTASWYLAEGGTKTFVEEIGVGGMKICIW